MKKIKKLITLLIILLLVSGSLSALGQNESGFSENVNEEQFYSLHDINNLSIDVSSADIRIKVINTNRLRVHLHGKVSGNKPYIENNQRADNLSVEIKRKFSFGFSSSSLTLDIEIPADYNKNLRLFSSSGDILIPNLEIENLEVELSSGDLHISSIEVNKFDYNSSSGELTADNIKSLSTKLKASSGSVEIDNFTGDLTANLSSGSLEVDFINFDNNIKVDNSSGDIIISLPSEANFQLDADTSSGEINCDYAITINGKQKRNKLNGIVGSGGNIIHIEASSGDISILKK
jgi:lia operon protein LiaG